MTSMAAKKQTAGKPGMKKQPVQAAKPSSTTGTAPLTEAGLDRRLIWLLAILSFFLFANTLTHGFVLDDIAVIEQNRFVQDGFAGIPKIMTTFYWQGYWDSNAGLYRPLSLVLFAMEWGISPENPMIHHFMNVLLYALTIGLLFRMTRLLFPAVTPWIPFSIVLLFAVHPIHTEVVANIKSRDEILCFLFFILTFNYILKNGLPSLKHKLIAAGLFLLCLLSKEAGILFLPIMGAYFLLFRKDTFLRATLFLLPLVVISAIWLGWHQYIINASAFERITYTYLDNSVVGCQTPAAQTATGIAILGRYLLKSVAPVNMSYDYSYNEIPCETFGSPAVLLTLAVVLGMLFFIYRCWKTRPAISFGLIWFLVSIALVTNVFTLIGATMGDRLLYVPVFGVCIVVVFGVYYLFRQTSAVSWKHSALYGFGLIALFFAVVSFQRNKDWESNATLFAADVRHAPNSARTHFNYATTLMQELPESTELQVPLLPEIVAEYEKALAIDPADRGAHTNLGVCYYRLKDYKKSVYHTRAALAVNPEDKSLTANLADAYFKDSLYDSAVVYYKQVIAAKTATAGNYTFMGVARFNQQRYAEAAVIFEQGLKHFPGNKDLMLNLGSTYGMANRLPESRRVLEKLVAIDPKNYQAIQFLGMTCDRMGDLEAARKWHDTLVQAGVLN
jgi:protein O-mannosyl-transferase